MLKFQEVTKVFQDGNHQIEAVKATTLHFNEGELIAIVGPSGSGKSTFLTMAGALQQPTSGEITIGHQKLSNLNEKALARVRMQQIGFILQTSQLIPFLTVQQQFQLLKRYKKDVMTLSEFEGLIKQLGLLEVMHLLPSALSGGQKQRVAIAKALYTKPTIILADEPTASLDTANALAVMDILKVQVKQRRKTCIIVTHDERLTAYCDRTFEMKDGILTEQCTTM
ncbi:ABC transporter ATP-binding protein [Staphylococcus lutrae]|uniref:Putative hemin import ATP-binding protein HrtA n=1 Tax=Staphylococcus lutrae TaxID=155085 RepID=A0AAC9RR36_9STAP|nr:ABC transporter ATP-binding protein [Staphylococcus lutrae]ARJ50773.1 peptide ABC transporter ATP-binding protein [Staphylococcus lutrae]PNZ36130.1 ABC transporter ATP-binding protein [Staphylococcus lutrae]